ncbi:TetR family transcriptional regulator [Mycobacterium sp. 852002-53434_SCH5985345]|uniref:TetR/AcrR family transcriptional regulator n=1 Tax=Mycobacterium sp. 852002-53434_SCH5985345 TaxID=1834107 RepID=UPI0007FE41A6|nr:TetR/AcrR family transcriptional regulator [Mycobacterium sp. 852002-53434_SCH5985345]OBF60886.1 TetR family transcriptional regulator [Mycobacterium sp. 852002-53434_SCH5985345]
MRSRGWAGVTPASDEEAIARILDAVDDVIAEHGSAIRLADVARRLGVTRQTVYRYFPNADALLIASAMRAVNGFIDQVVHHVSGLNDPVTAIVEIISFAVENLTGDPQLEKLLTRPPGGEAATSLTSDTAIIFCLSAFDRLDVDWKLHGFDATALNELAEMTLRTVHSLLTDPGQRQRDGSALRRFVARWLGPAILYPRMTSLPVHERHASSDEHIEPDRCAES